jgi:hypothetical protein
MLKSRDRLRNTKQLVFLTVAGRIKSMHNKVIASKEGMKWIDSFTLQPKRKE